MQNRELIAHGFAITHKYLVETRQCLVSTLKNSISTYPNAFLS